IDFGGAALALIERLEHHIRCREVRRIDRLQCVKAGISGYEVDTFHRMRKLDDLARDLVGTLERSAFGKLGARKQIQLVLRRNKAAGHVMKQHRGYRKQCGVDDKHCSAPLERLLDRELVTLRRTVKEAIERPEQPAEKLVDHPRDHVVVAAVLPEQLC